MVEKGESSPENLEFHDLKVKTMVGAVNQVIVRKGLANRWLERTEKDIARCQLAQQNNRDLTSKISIMQEAMAAETPFMPLRTHYQGEDAVESVYLVKVDTRGRILVGSVCKIGTLDPRTHRAAEVQPEFTVDDLESVHVLSRMIEELPWQPDFNQGFSSRDID